MPTTEAAISLKNLSKHYDDVVALSSVSIDVPPGEVFGLIGPNGAGKTTLLRILAALTEPTRGEAFVMGLEVQHNLREVHRTIGFMPDFYNPYDELTAS